MKVTQFKDEAQKRKVSLEAIRCTFEKELDSGLILGIVAPNGTEAICFEPHEIDSLSAELSNGKISIENLAEQLSISVYQVRLVLQHMLKTKRIDGELTYSSFISKGTSKKNLLLKAAEHKHNHRLKLRNKRS